MTDNSSDAARRADFSDSDIDPHSLGMAAVGETVRFLGVNGHAYELQDALEAFEPGALLTVEACEIGGWVSYYRFVEEAGLYNTVMFEPEQSQ